jgi:NDP-sugar pyrophosphorylase family protein
MDFLARISDRMRNFFEDVPEFTHPTEIIEHLTGRSFVKPEGIIGGEGLVRQNFTTVVGPVVVGHNVHIGPYCFLRGPLFLDDNVHVGPYSEIVRCVVLKDSAFYHRNLFLDAVIGERAKFAGLATCCNMSPRGTVNVHYRGEKTEYSKRFGATIEDDTYAGVNTIFSPGAHMPEGMSVPGPCVVYGQGKVRSVFS